MPLDRLVQFRAAGKLVDAARNRAADLGLSFSELLRAGLHAAISNPRPRLGHGK